MELSFEGAWQKVHFTPSAALNPSITLSRSSLLIFLGSIFRFLYLCSSGGLVAAMPATINKLTNMNTNDFFLKSIFLILKPNLIKIPESREIFVLFYEAFHEKTGCYWIYFYHPTD